MRLVIEHITGYAYSAPTRHSVQYVRLTPRDDPGQTVAAWRMDTSGRTTPWIDGFGNRVHCIVRQGDHLALDLRVQGEVDTDETHGIVPVSAHGPPPQAFLRQTHLTAIDESIRSFAAPFAALRARSDLNAMHALMGEIHDRIAYVPGDTHVHSSAAAVLAQGSGVCQDHAHVFIACCHSLGIPARYVSGYLHTAAEDGRHLATHAWAEALVDHLGWVSFDPSNRQSATPAYVRLAVAFDYRGAAPVAGIRLGGGTEEMHVRVRVGRGEAPAESWSCQQQ